MADESMNILYITPEYGTSISGGAVGSKRNYDMLISLFGSRSIHKLVLKENPNNSFIEKVSKNIKKWLTSEQYDLSPLKRIDVRSYDCVFLDTSLIGHVATQLRHKGYKGKIVCFFHNCELILNSQMYANRNILVKFPMIKIPRVNEQAALQDADAVIILNDRDKKNILEHYTVKSKVFIIPVSMQDKFIEDKEETIHDKPIYTFLGSYFKPNIDGICWFMENVVPYVDIHLRVIGRGMNQLPEKYHHINNVEILSDVPDLTIYMKEADYMLYPIFEGSGMKLKTCEALMYGKNIIGTSEAFCGYEVQDFSRIGARCDTKDEFIRAIEEVNLPHFNRISRQLYLDKYSYEATLRMFRHVFEELHLVQI